MKIVKRVIRIAESLAIISMVLLVFGAGLGSAQYGEPTPTTVTPATPVTTPTATPAAGTPVVTPTTVPPAGIGLELKASGLTAPLAAVSPDDGTGRLFIVDQVGIVRILTADGVLMDEPFLDVSSKLVALNLSYDERGLLGLAFHPDFKNNGRFFIYYSAPLKADAPAGYDHTNVISEMKVAQGNPDKADPNFERILIQEDQPQVNHNAGQITFGPDGFLYIPMGDGGGANDVGPGHSPGGNAQNISTIKGKILRIDVNSGDPYGIPADNPFTGVAGARPEIFALGLRNPFHIAFDAGGNQSLFSQDAGQALWEEVDIITKGGNYGWNIKEGTHCFDPNNNTTSPSTCPNTSVRGEPLIDPIIEFANAKQPGGLAFVVIGGNVYRGSEMPELNGAYIFGGATRNLMAPDGSIFIATPPSAGGQMWQMSELNITTSGNGRINHIVRSFGQDDQKELYVLASEILGPTGNTGKVFKIVPPGPTPNVTVTPNMTVTPNATVTPIATATPAVTVTVTGTPAVTIPGITGIPGVPVAVPEFPTVVLPVAAVMGLVMLLLYRRRDK